MFLRKLGKRGAEMVEYAIVLACIAAVGVGFYSSNDSKLTGVLDSLFGNVRQVLGLEGTSYKYKTKLVDQDKQYQEVMDSLINGIYAALGTKDKPLASVSIGPNGQIKSYSTYDKNGKVWSKPLTPEQQASGYANKFLINGYTYGQGDTLLHFSQEGQIIDKNIGSSSLSVNNANRVIINDGTSQKTLYYNGLSQDFSSESGYWQKGLESNAP